MKTQPHERRERITTDEKLKTIAARVTAEEYALIQAYCEKNNISISEAILDGLFRLLT